MATCSGVCGITISCPNGCGVFCTSDCTDCTQWCEPTTLEAFDRADAEPPSVLRTVRGGKGEARQYRWDELQGGEVSAPPVGLGDTIQVSLNDVRRSTLARLMGLVLGTRLRASERASERVSLTMTGTAGDVLAKLDLAGE